MKARALVIVATLIWNWVPSVNGQTNVNAHYFWWDTSDVEDIQADIELGNDECVDTDGPSVGAIELTFVAGRVAVDANNQNASQGEDDVGYCCHKAGVDKKGLATIWYRFKATTSSARIHTCDSTADGATDSLLQIFHSTRSNAGKCADNLPCTIGGTPCADGSQCLFDPITSCNNLEIVGCNDDFAGCGIAGKNSSICVTNLIVGDWYYIMLGSFDSTTRGRYRLTVETPCPESQPPSNDSCRFPITVFTGTTAFNLARSTMECPAEPCVPEMTTDVWFIYNATCSGLATVHTCGASAATSPDTTLAMYYSFTCPPQKVYFLASNDDACSPSGKACTDYADCYYGVCENDMQTTCVPFDPGYLPCPKYCAGNMGRSCQTDADCATPVNVGPCLPSACLPDEVCNMATCAARCNTGTCESASCGRSAYMQAPVILGLPYFIRLGGSFGGTPSGTLTITCAQDDCNNNGIPDLIDISYGLAGVLDCNFNNEPDVCDVDPSDPDGDGLLSADSDSNGIPDECDTAPPLITTNSPLPTLKVGDAYQILLRAQGGVAPYSWAIVSGALPPGLTIAASTGRISGTPLQAGDFEFRVRVNGSNGLGSEKDFTLSVAPAAGTLFVSPGEPFNSSGYEFGPFSPAQRTYTPRNIGTTAINWTATNANGALFALSQSGGNLPPGASTSVTVTVVLNEAASLPPGVYADTISFSNTTNGRGNTTRGAQFTVLNAQPAPGEDDPPRRVSLDHLWEWNETLGRFAPPGPDGIVIDTDQPTYLLTHGWDGDLAGETCEAGHSALSSIACAIHQELPNANLLAWEWADIANPNNRCDLPDAFLAEGGLNIFIAFAEVYLTGGASVLRFVVSSAANVALIFRDARLSGMAARDEGYKLGMALANEIRTSGSLGSELHFIGKSHGGGVLGFAALVLRNRGFAPDSLTTLDTPRLCKEAFCVPFVGCFSEICIVESLSNVAPFAQSGEGRTAVFYYPDLLGGGFGQPVPGAHANIELNPDIVPNFDPLDPLNPQWIDHLWISGLDRPGECVAGDGWYPDAVRSASVRFDSDPVLSSILAIDQYPSGCFAEGPQFRFSQEPCTTLLRGAPDATATSGLSVIAYDPFVSAATWTGNLAQLRVGVDPGDAENRAVILREQGNASFFKDIAWPGDAVDISFDYVFLPPLGQESLTVYLGDEIVYYDNADVTLATERLSSSGPIYVGGVAGSTARLNFVLRTDEPDGGELGGAVVLDNLRVYGLRPGDIDFDGDRDLVDFYVFQQCFKAVSLSPACAFFDFNGDGVVDELDYTGDPSGVIVDGFVDLIDGPKVPPIP